VLPSVVRIVFGEVGPAQAGLESSVVTSMLQIGSAFGATAISGAFFSVLSRGTSAFHWYWQGRERNPLESDEPWLHKPRP
jgi:hypothetical protein